MRIQRFVQRLAGGALVCGALAVAGSANAGTMVVRDRASGPPPSVFLTGTNGDLIASLDGDPFTIFRTGTLDLEKDPGGGFEAFLTYCTEPDAGLSFGTNPPDTVGAVYNIEPFPAPPAVTAAEQEQLEILWSNAFVNSTTSSLNAAAFQAFVWEIFRDDAFDLAAGTFLVDAMDSFSSDAAALASLWYGNITGGVWTTRTPLEHLTSSTSQNLLHVVPEPASLGLLALGGLVALARRR